MSETTGALEGPAADWQRRVVSRSLRTARARSIDRGSTLIRAATALLERSGGDTFTVQDIADEAGQSLRTLYQRSEERRVGKSVSVRVDLGGRRIIKKKNKKKHKI